MSQAGNHEALLRSFLQSLAQNQSSYAMLISTLESWEKAETDKLNQMATAALLDETKKPLALMQLGKVQAIQDAVIFARHNIIH